MNVSGKFCDLRFLFEVCYYLRKDYYEIIYEEGRFEGKEILLLMVKEIYNSISFNRFETILNVEKKMILYSLKRGFKPIDPQWIYLIGD